MADAVLSRVTEGWRGQPGEPFKLAEAVVAHHLRGRPFGLQVLLRRGSNQGYLQDHERIERSFRANTLDELLKIAVAEIRSGSELNDADVLQAVRSAIYEAEDAFTEYK